MHTGRYAQSGKDYYVIKLSILFNIVLMFDVEVYIKSEYCITSQFRKTQATWKLPTRDMGEIERSRRSHPHKPCYQVQFRRTLSGKTDLFVRCFILLRCLFYQYIICNWTAWNYFKKSLEVCEFVCEIWFIITLILTLITKLSSLLHRLWRICVLTKCLLSCMINWRWYVRTTSNQT